MSGACTNLLLAALAAGGPAQTTPRRYLLALGSNLGDPADPVLHYAERDAERFTEALREVGGVRPGDAVILESPDADQLAAAMRDLGARLRSEAGPGDQLVVYVSSHADEGDLHLGGTRYPIRQLAAFVRDAPVGVGLLVIDSCRSGSAVQIKGLRPISGATVEVNAPEVTGRVIISSSGSNEYAQESELLQGSYFTHHLISALRGAADTSGDGVVTLQEAYDYASARTIESTFATPAGVQHPAFRVDLRGRGELTLSRPGQARGKLVFPSPDPGEYLVVSAETDDVVGQLVKASGPAIFAVEPGRYRVQLRQEGHVRQAQVSVPDQGEGILADDRWTAVSQPWGAAKGAGPWLWLGADLTGAAETRNDGPTAGLGVRAALTYGSSIEWVAHLLVDGNSTSSTKVTKAGGGAAPAGPAAAAPIPATGVGGVELRAGPGISGRWGQIIVGVSAQLGAGVVWLADTRPDGDPKPAAMACAGMAPEVRVLLTPHLALEVSCFAGAALTAAADRILDARFEGSAGVSWGF